MWTKTLHRDYLQRFPNFSATVLNIVSKKCLCEALQSTAGMKLVMKLYLCKILPYLCWHKFSQPSNLFYRVPMGNCLWYNFRQLFISLSSAVGRCKKECKTSKIIVIPGFCRFSIGFRSNKNPTRHVNSELVFSLVNVLVSATFSWSCSRGLHKRGAWPLKTRRLHRNVYIYLSLLNALIIPQV